MSVAGLKRALARRLIGAPEEASLFNDGSDHLTAWVRLKEVHIERSRQFGDVYLALSLWRGVGLGLIACLRTRKPLRRVWRRDAGSCLRSKPMGIKVFTHPGPAFPTDTPADGTRSE
jgi:hypothetical protein